MSIVKRNRTVVAAAALLLLPSLAWGAGFALFEHGSRGMAMGGAMTAVADDPSAFFWNPAGLTQLSEDGLQVQFGASFITPTQDFEGGGGPYPGPGYTASQKSQTFFPPHMYVVYPINDRLVTGVGVMAPFGLGTWWEDDHAGRFISKRVALTRVDVNPTVAYRFNDHVSAGVGITYASSSIDLTPALGFVNPYTQQLTDIGQVHLYGEQSENTGFGWNAGLHFDIGEGWSAGFSYRSKIKIEYEGVGSFTQYPTGYPEFDAAVAAAIPFGENVPVETEIKFPDYFSAGIAWSNEQWTFSGQWGYMGWSTFAELPLNFVGYPELSGTVPENYYDAHQWRFGAEYRASETWTFRAGYLRDKTPQPRESMSPLLGDSDRTGPSIGIGWTKGPITIDIADLYLFMEDRSTLGNSIDGYDGEYSGNANLISFTLTCRF